MRYEINSKIVKGRMFRRLNNDVTKDWDRVCLTPFETSDDFQDRIRNIHPRPYKRKEK